MFRLRSSARLLRELREASRSYGRREWLSGGALASAARTTSLLCPLPGLDVPQCLPDQLGGQPTRVTTLPNGVRVASEDVPGPSACVGVFVDSGSVYETAETAGMSHLLEKLAFKDTAHRSHLQIVQDVEATGGNIGACAYREQMVYSYETLKAYLPQAIEVLIDCVHNSLFLQDEVGRQSDPFLREWTKPTNNPLIEPVGQGLNSDQFRDPTTGWIGPDGLWRIAVGAELNGYSAALLYKSKDFMQWTRVDHPLYSSNASTMWECPDFFAVLPGKNNGLDLSAAIPNGAKHVLKMSLDHCDKYMIGVYDLKRDMFVPDTILDDRRLWLRIDYGDYYASKSFFDSKKGRRIIWGWTNETDSTSDDIAKGWAGIHAIPRTIWLDGDGKRLLQWPVEEVESLRRTEVSHQGIELKKGNLFEIKGTDTLQADVEIDFELGAIDAADPFDPSWLLDTEKHCREADASVPCGLGPFGLVLLASDNMDEQTAVHFRVYKSEQKYMVLLCSDLRRSSLRPGLYTPAYGGFFEYDLENEKKISLRTLIDRSAVESFGSCGRACIMARVYSAAVVDGATHMYAFNNGTSMVKVSQLKAWSMRRAQVNVKKGWSE